MKINWRVRFKNKVWLMSFLSLIVGFVYNVLAAFDVFPKITEPMVTKLIGEILTFLGFLGVLQDPTTEGLSDSNRAMNYNEPWNDKVDSDD